MWAAFKLLSWQAKLGITIGILAILAAIMGSTAYVSYQKGLMKSREEIQKYQTKSQTLQKKLAEAQGKVDVKTVTKYKDRIKYVEAASSKAKMVVQQSVPEQFTLSKGWIYAYNQSVLGLELDPAKAADATPSSTSEMRALLTIAPNNGICLANKAQLESLQQWIRDTEAAREKVTN